MLTITIFASSLSCASIMLLLKEIETRRGERNAILALISRLDERASQVSTKFKFRLFQIIQTVRYIILVHSKDILKSLLNRVHEKILAEYRVRENIIMGRRELNSKGAVSFYLKKISEEKVAVEGCRIEE